MNRKIILVSILFTIFLDSFNLGLIYPIFTSLVFEGSDLLGLKASEYLKNAVFSFLIAAFPFGQFLGAPIIGQLSDQFGRRKLLILSLLGTAATLLLCAVGVLFSSLTLLLLSRFSGGLMAGNMTLAYASLADFSTEKDKVKNFALIPLMCGLGFSLGPYVAGILENPALPFFIAVGMTLINLILVYWKFPDTFVPKQNTDLLNRYASLIKNCGRAFHIPLVRTCLTILLLMLSANFLFVQFVGPFAINRLSIGIADVGILYVNIGIAVALGHLVLTRGLANYLSPEKALSLSLVCLGSLLIVLLFAHSLIALHILTFFIMLACAVGYTNSITLVSNAASQEQQGEIMGLAVSAQSLAEFLPAFIFGLMAGFSQSIPLAAAALCAGGAFLMLKKT